MGSFALHFYTGFRDRSNSMLIFTLVSVAVTSVKLQGKFAVWILYYNMGSNERDLRRVSVRRDRCTDRKKEGYKFHPLRTMLVDDGTSSEENRWKR
ncbi:hypothetical protein TNCV_4814461 [Trichonephila clavipes]|nr:hypothetical protein TNCV_4814461 [Trichonephila clavipes]